MEEVILSRLKTGPVFFSSLKRSIVGNYPEMDRTLVFRAVSELIRAGKIRFTSSGSLAATEQS